MDYVNNTVKPNEAQSALISQCHLTEHQPVILLPTSRVARPQGLGLSVASVSFVPWTQDLARHTLLQQGGATRTRS